MILYFSGTGNSLAIARKIAEALAKHPWYEPDSVAHSIAERHDIQLLDQPIGTVVYF
jgi:flavodoxin